MKHTDGKILKRERQMQAEITPSAIFPVWDSEEVPAIPEKLKPLHQAPECSQP
jgi:hypothetical protein